MDTRRLERVLIIKPSSLGDIIHALPVATSIKSEVPGVQIDWVAARPYVELLEGNPSVDRIITFDRGMLKGPGRTARLLAFVRELRRERYSIVVDLQGLLRSALMAFVCRTAMRAGFANAREGAPLFYDLKVTVPGSGMHAVDRYMLVPKALGMADHGVSFSIGTSPVNESEALALLKEAGISDADKFIAVAPSARWETKRWEAANFVGVANTLFEKHGIKSVFVGTAADAAVLDGSNVPLAQKGAELFGRTSIRTLASIFRRAGAVLTNDSGPMHIAAAVGTPTVAIFGPTDPRLTGPYGSSHRVLTPAEECAPCFRRDCKDVRCLAGITADEVYRTVAKTLGI